MTLLTQCYRHHVRFFPKRSVYAPMRSSLALTKNTFSRLSDGDKSGNCPAGLLVDKHINNPNYDDFYLQSHAGLLGSTYNSDVLTG